MPKRKVGEEKGDRSKLVDGCTLWTPPFTGQFAFFADKNWRYSNKGYDLIMPHRHECFEAGYCHNGKGHFEIAGKLMAFKKSDMVFINENEAHVAYFNEKCEWTWLYFNPVKILIQDPATAQIADTSSFSGPSFHNVVSARQQPALHAVMSQLLSECSRKKPYHDSAVRALVWLLMVELHRNFPVNKRRGVAHEKSASHTIETFKPAIEFVYMNYSKKIHVDQLAHQVCMSPVTFRRAFTRVVGKTPYEYLTAIRIAMAARDIENTSMSLEEIGFANGFDDYSSFRRAFKLSTEVSPAEWRRRSRS